MKKIKKLFVLPFVAIVATLSLSVATVSPSASWATTALGKSFESLNPRGALVRATIPEQAPAGYYLLEYYFYEEDDNFRSRFYLDDLKSLSQDCTMTSGISVLAFGTNGQAGSYTKLVDEESGVDINDISFPRTVVPSAYNEYTHDVWILLYNSALSNQSKYFEFPHVSISEMDYSLYDSSTYVASYYASELPTTDNNKPLISGTSIFVVNVDEPLTTGEIVSHVSAYDEIDGECNVTVVEDNYSANKTTPGVYTITVSATDSSNNTGTAVLTIHVVDNTKPVITANKKTVEVSYKDKLNLSTLPSVCGITVTDNVDDNLSVVYESDTYQDNYNIPGTYYVKYAATDKAGNYQSTNITIKVVDDVAPNITGTTKIDKYALTKLTVDDIKALLKAEDELSGKCTITVSEDNYTAHANETGSYTVIFQATDTTGNIATCTVIINVTDKIPPVFVCDEYIINVDSTTIIDTTYLTTILEYYGVINNNQSVALTMLSNEYVGNENVPGTYSLSVEVTDIQTKESDVVDLKIKVLGETKIEDNIEINGFQKIINWFSNIFNQIGLFFTTLFNKLKEFWNWLF